ncbi:hypothetical protein XPU_0190 [Xanthomonas arboricola pv. pruni str. MAFF 311562]|uniref:Uncharacterized protein n=1 Tax=Xanthomonas arboricola pv. pruni str. MAFF 311562 TaxID=1414836 RepID=W4RXP2_9XANT|nr:hypothetical protein XPU_0190 [Xanthomonas arboricola pv. pruni str. MAFF 311562]
MPADLQPGLEAALQASGLLDAWVTPDGQLLDAGGAPLPHDAQWLGRPARPDSLAAWLQPAPPAEATPMVAPAVLQRLFEGVACGEQDDPGAEAWIGPGGRFRLGALAGAWHKPRAEFIGYAARAAARARRLAEIAQRLEELDLAHAQLQAGSAQLAADQRQAASEWQSAPTDDTLRAAHLQASTRVRELDAARLRLDQAEHALRSAIQQWEAASQTLEQDARDLALPPARDALHTIDRALLAFGDRLHALTSAARACHDALAEHRQQVEREQQARTDAEHATEQAAERDLLAEEARIRLQTLRESVGAKVEELQQRIRDARQAVSSADLELKSSNEALRLAGETRARAEQKVEAADAILSERIASRQQAIEHWQASPPPACSKSHCPMPNCRRRPRPGPSNPPWPWHAAPNRRCCRSRTTTTPGTACRTRCRRTTPNSAARWPRSATAPRPKPAISA